MMDATIYTTPREENPDGGISTAPFLPKTRKLAKAKWVYKISFFGKGTFDLQSAFLFFVMHICKVHFSKVIPFANFDFLTAIMNSICAIQLQSGIFIVSLKFFLYVIFSLYF